MSSYEFVNKVDILLVEDNPGDVLLTQEAFRSSKLINDLHVVVDGEEATKFLRKEDGYVDVPRPDLILLDLNLPKKDGREVLRDIKSDETLKSIPVIVLTSSEAEEDVLISYNLHANCYITKPVTLDSFISVLHKIEEFWLEIVKIPKIY